MCYNGFSRIRENAGFRTVLSAGREYRILTRPDCHFDILIIVSKNLCWCEKNMYIGKILKYYYETRICFLFVL